jgi:hypothetical protein
MNARLTNTLALLLAGAMLAGCSKSPGTPLAPTSGAPGGSGTSGTANDQVEISQTMASEPQLIDDGQFQSTDLSRIDGIAGAAAAINPLYFFRNITSIQSRVEFAFSDTDSTGRPTTALVTVHRLLQGTFDIATGPRIEATVRDTARLAFIKKPLADNWERHILLKRALAPPITFASNLERPRWRIAGTSGVEVTSRGATTKIVQLEIKTSTRDTVITDPLALFRLRAVMKFDPAEQVTLIATTQRNDDVVVLVRAGLRTRFTSNGDNTYTLVWHTPQWGGLFHVGVNALSNGTLFDDQAPYDSQAWIVPCLVAPMELAEFMP